MPRLHTPARRLWPLRRVSAAVGDRARAIALVGCLLAPGSCTPAAERAGDTAVASASATVTGPMALAAADTTVPDGPLGRSVRRGRAIMLATHDSLPRHVGNALRCTSCHLDEGRRAGGIPWVGVYARFPQYRSRSGRVIGIEERVNGCLLRSMNGTALPVASDDMRDIVAYLAYLSRGVPVGSDVAGQGLPALEPLEPDTAAGRVVFAARCTVCHGPDGQGTTVAPPLWGPQSYNIGAGMARLRTAAAFIHANMPNGSADLTPQQAYDVAAYVNSHERPDLAGKEHDWPNGDAPPDAAYPTRAGRRDQGSHAGQGGQ